MESRNANRCVACLYMLILPFITLWDILETTEWALYGRDFREIWHIIKTGRTDFYSNDDL